MKIENIHSFKEALRTGINLFAGAGFSILAKDKYGKSLPLGTDLLKELCGKFSITSYDLPQLATILRNTNNSEFNKYLTERFSVNEFDNLYDSLNDVCIKYFFTTNIDNLIPCIIKRGTKRYIHDIRDNGENIDPNAIAYLPLHGNVDRPNEGYIFTTAEISSIFGNAPRTWSYLSTAIEKTPTLFLGYSLQDSSTLQALFSVRHTKPDAQKDKWILLYNPLDAEVAYFQALGFKIITGSICDFLKELPELLNADGHGPLLTGFRPIRELFRNNLIPASRNGLRARSIIHFFKGMEPIWGDILSGNIVKTSQYDTAINSLREPHRHTVIIGAPLCGKSTTAMQAASAVTGFDIKLTFDDMTVSKAEYLLKFIGNGKALIMVENFADNIDAFLKLSEGTNVKLVGVARSTDFGIISHRINSEQFNIINVTEVLDTDLQRVYRSLPKASKKEKFVHHKADNRYKRDTIFEFVVQNIKGQSIEERYIEILKNSVDDHVEFLVLCAYMHYCRIPLSIEVAASYFSETHSYEEMFKLKKELDDLINEFEDNDLSDMDYYYPRSFHLADVILRNSSTHTLRKVLKGVIENVPQLQIPRYNTFKRHAFDHRLIARAFKKWNEGCEFYESAFADDYANPYILQQQALYLSKFKQYRLAFDIIDRAKTMTNDSQFSIRNTHAIILFEANYRSDDENAISQLDESMKILKKCYKDDKRKTYHATVFAEQAIRYYSKMPSEITIDYLKLSKQWLTEEKQNNPWNKECLAYLGELNDMLSKIS